MMSVRRRLCPPPAADGGQAAPPVNEHAARPLAVDLAAFAPWTLARDPAQPLAVCGPRRLAQRSVAGRRARPVPGMNSGVAEKPGSTPRGATVDGALPLSRCFD